MEREGIDVCELVWLVYTGAEREHPMIDACKGASR